MSNNDSIVTRRNRNARDAGTTPQAHLYGSNSQMVTQITTLDDNGNMTNMLETTTTIRNGKKIVKSMAMDYNKRTITRQIARSRLDSKKFSRSSKKISGSSNAGAVIKTIKPKAKPAPKPVFDVDCDSEESDGSYESDESLDDSRESAAPPSRMEYTPWSSMMKSSFDEFSKAFDFNRNF